MNPLAALVLASACVLPLTAFAQWQWVDGSGRKVFSDKAPPPEILPKNILRQPGLKGLPPAAQEAADAAAATKTAANAPKVTGRDKALEEKKKQADEEAAEKRKAQEAAVAAAKADNCARAKQAKVTYDSGLRISRTNAKGEREILDDQQRAAEVKHIQSVIDRECA